MTSAECGGNSGTAMQINNICITGQFETEEIPESGKKCIKFYDNNIVLKKNCFSMTLTDNIREVLQIKNLKKMIQKRIEHKKGISIHNLRWKIGNIHKSLKIPCTPKEVTRDLLPAVLSKFGINKTFVTQEQNRSMIADIGKVISDQFPFILIKLCTLNNSSTVKIQLSKNHQFIQITLILTAFNRETRELVNFLENQTWHQKTQ